MWGISARKRASANGVFSKLWAPLGYRLFYGTYYLGVPKSDPDFGNYPNVIYSYPYLETLRKISALEMHGPFRHPVGDYVLVVKGLRFRA